MTVYSAGSSGFEVVSAVYDSNTSAFIIDVAYSRNSDSSVLAFFIPRSQTDSHGYTAQFNNTFRGANFPCSVSDLSSVAATTCCLTNFSAHYRVPTNFTFAPGASCTSPFANPPPLTMQDAISGSFGADMPSSGVVAIPTQAGLPPSVSMARFSLALADLWAASLITNEGSQSFKTFVGLAQFAKVPDSRILDSSSSQVQLNLVYSEYYQVMYPRSCCLPRRLALRLSDLVTGDLRCWLRRQHFFELYRRASKRGAGCC